MTLSLFIVFTLMTAAAIGAVLWPLSRRAATTRSGSDVAVYRDQLDEIERDRAAGLIGEQEAEAARIEVSRRLLAAAEVGKAASPVTSTALPYRRAVAVVALVVVPVSSIGLYLMLGSPALPGQPIAARLAEPVQSQSIDSLVTHVEAHLERNPGDGRGWEVIAPVYMRLGRFDQAVAAWRHVLRLNGESAEHEADLGEALVAAANGIVTADAKSAFDRALALDATEISARFYLALAAEQDGRRDGAAKMLRGILAGAPDGAPWIDTVRRALARVEGHPASGPTGPSAAEMQTASRLPPDQQNTMIRNMVERLAARLHKDGSDIEGWLRLVRSYRVLGESKQADAAIVDARQALAKDPEKLHRFYDGVKQLGSGG